MDIFLQKRIDYLQEAFIGWVKHGLIFIFGWTNPLRVFSLIANAHQN